MPSQDENAVRALLDGVYAAWAANDADAFVAEYAPHANAVHSGYYMENRDAIRATIAYEFAGRLKDSRAVHEVQSVRFIGTDAAIVLSKASIVFAGQSEPAPESRTLDTWVLSKQDAAWNVERFHNCAEIAA